MLFGKSPTSKLRRFESCDWDTTSTWDATWNLIQWDNTRDLETENFSYDFLDRLTSASLSGGYAESYSYNQIVNIISKGGISYTYGSSKPHAVTQVGSTT
jgi:hypothetical protein